MRLYLSIYLSTVTDSHRLEHYNARYNKKQRLDTRLGMSVTTQGGSGRQYVTGPGRNISKYRFVVLNVYRFREN